MRKAIVDAWVRECHDEACLARGPHSHHLTWFGKLHLKLAKFYIPEWVR